MLVQTALRSFESAYCMAKLLPINPMAEADGGGSNAVLHIYPSEGAYADIGKQSSGIGKVVGIVSKLVQTHIFGMEISFGIVQMIGVDSGLGVLVADGQAKLFDEDAGYLRSKLAEGLLHMR